MNCIPRLISLLQSLLPVYDKIRGPSIASLFFLFETYSSMDITTRKVVWDCFSPPAPLNALSGQIPAEFKSHPIIANLILTQIPASGNSPQSQIDKHSLLSKDWLEKGILTL